MVRDTLTLARARTAAEAGHRALQAGQPLGPSFNAYLVARGHDVTRCVLADAFPDDGSWFGTLLDEARRAWRFEWTVGASTPEAWEDITDEYLREVRRWANGRPYRDVVVAWRLSEQLRGVTPP